MLKVNQRVYSRARTKTISPNSVLIFILLFYKAYPSCFQEATGNSSLNSHLLYKAPYTTLLQLHKKNTLAISWG